MMGLPTNGHKRAFWQADLDEAAGHLVDVIREVRPQVVVTYDANGSYGHPDHIQSHRVAMRAAELATAGGFGPDKVYWSAIPRSVMASGLELFAQTENNPFEGVTNVDEIPMAVPDERIAARIDARDFADAKMAAVRAHATQIPPTSWLFSLAKNMGADFLGVEYFELVVGDRGPAGPDGLETDLFAGLPLR
jgi:N-acetyl-1-D-myo-inositol-2-amino-2-deoxy-alpha-D-glucopyranoside deacetylase